MHMRRRPVAYRLPWGLSFFLNRHGYFRSTNQAQSISRSLSAIWDFGRDFDSIVPLQGFQWYWWRGVGESLQNYF